MAKPIQKTPTLTGADADTFIRRMIEAQKRPLNAAEKEYVRLLRRG